MRRLFIVLGFISAVLALIIAVTPLSQIAYVPAVAALIFALIAFYMAKQKQYPKKSIQLIFLLTFIALVLTTYKSVFNVAEIGNLDELELKEEASIEDSKELLEELDLEIDESELEIETEDLEGLQEE
jgi:hypothetical protein